MLSFWYSSDEMAKPQKGIFLECFVILLQAYCLRVRFSSHFIYRIKESSFYGQHNILKCFVLSIYSHPSSKMVEIQKITSLESFDYFVFILTRI